MSGRLVPFEPAWWFAPTRGVHGARACDSPLGARARHPRHCEAA